MEAIPKTQGALVALGPLGSGLLVQAANIAAPVASGNVGNPAPSVSASSSIPVNEINLAPGGLPSISACLGVPDNESNLASGSLAHQ
eukprot:1574516-Heterocapsa_arctica.AAC.1